MICKQSQTSLLPPRDIRDWSGSRDWRREVRGHGSLSGSTIWLPIAHAHWTIHRTYISVYPQAILHTRCQDTTSEMPYVVIGRYERIGPDKVQILGRPVRDPYGHKTLLVKAATKSSGLIIEPKERTSLVVVWTAGLWLKRSITHSLRSGCLMTVSHDDRQLFVCHAKERSVRGNTNRSFGRIFQGQRRGFGIRAARRPGDGGPVGGKVRSILPGSAATSPPTPHPLPGPTTRGEAT